jgi:hypothetical protein
MLPSFRSFRRSSPRLPRFLSGTRRELADQVLEGVA